MIHTGPFQPRRGLIFNDLTEVIEDVHRLRQGNRPTGNWTLAQTCHHIADTLHGSIDGLGVTKHRIMRTLFGRCILRQVFETNILGDGFTVTKKLNPPDDVDLDEAVTALKTAIARYHAHTGPLHLHPFFGWLDRAEWDRLHLIHAAHHLKRLVPHIGD